MMGFFILQALGSNLTSTQQFEIVVLVVIGAIIADHFNMWDRLFGRFKPKDDRGFVAVVPEPPWWFHNLTANTVSKVIGYIPGADDGVVWDATIVVNAGEGAEDESVPISSDKCWVDFRITDLNKKEIHIYFDNRGISDALKRAIADRDKSISRLNAENKGTKHKLGRKIVDIDDQLTMIHESRGRDYRAPTPRGHRQDATYDNDQNPNGDRGFKD